MNREAELKRPSRVACSVLLGIVLLSLEHRAGNGAILKIRAFVAGPGDVRRVRDLVSEIFTESQKPLPLLSLIRCGGLPLEGAQVVLEAIASSSKRLNPDGLAFVSGQMAVPPTHSTRWSRCWRNRSKACARRFARRERPPATWCG